MKHQLRLLFVTLLFGMSHAMTAQNVSVDELLPRVYHFADSVGKMPDDFGAEAYVRFQVEAERKNVFLKFVPGMSGFRSGHSEVFGETAAAFHYSKSGGFELKEKGRFSSLGVINEDTEKRIGRFNMSIYETSFFSDRILSPLNRRNRKYYRYKIETDSLSRNNGLVKVRVSPRFANAQLVKGSFYADSLSGAVRRVDFKFRYDYVRVRVAGNMGVTKDDCALPVNLEVFTDFKFFRNKVRTVHQSYVDYEFPTKHPASSKGKRRLTRFDLTESMKMRIDTTKSCNNRQFFDETRPFPLPPKHEAAYDSMSHQKKNQFPAGEQHRRIKNVAPVAENIFLDSHELQMGKRGQFYVPAVITPSMVEWSKSKGLALQTRLAMKWDFKEDRLMSIDPTLGYNFKQERMYWNVPIVAKIAPQKDVEFRFSIGNGNRIYNSEQTEQLLEKFGDVYDYDSLANFLEQFQFNYYNDLHIKGSVGFQPIVGLRLSTETRFHLRTMEEWNEYSSSGGMQRIMRSFAPSVHIEWTPCLYYYRQGNKRVALHSKYPTFDLDYERGLSLARCESKYEKLEFSARWRLKLYALRSLYFRLSAGGYTNRSNAYFVDYEYFRDKNLHDNWKEETGWEFQLIDARLYNASKYYAKLSAVYESPMLMFSRVPFLTRIVQNERLYVNVLQSQMASPYAEIGYGIGTYVADAGVFMSAASGGSYGFGFKVALRLFEDW